MGVRKKYISITVEKILNQYNIEAPPIDVEELAAALGITIQYKPADDKLSGFLIRDLKNHSAVIGVNSSHPQNRQRFTIAHEIGHFLLHESGKLYMDRINNIFRVQHRNQDSSKGTNVEEKEANLFAAELLMPEKFLAKDLDNCNTLNLLDEEQLSKLADSYRVSTQALTFRLAYLQYILL
ncbi:MAG: ImmA/IrrE family metallo-endopeptidase [Rivularia sp. (in: cyanobacteria)]